MVFNTTFNNISVISWRSFLLVEEIGVPGENRRPAEQECKLMLIRLQEYSYNYLFLLILYLV
jgi:hypothetical protein